jgi:O-6-methylguanine DNA methyltransferase
VCRSRTFLVKQKAKYSFLLLSSGERVMISVYAKEAGGSWFGLAYIGEEIIATAVGSTKEETIMSLMKSLQSYSEFQIVEEGSEFAERMILMLKKLDSGNEEHKIFSLATEYVPEPLAKVLKVAAAIPIGCVASYGAVAKMADTEPRIVGKIMATNPLYPLVPCHRVVGADFSLVGYGGRKNQQALQAKLCRLRKEARGFTAKKEIPVNGKKLVAYPVEHVITKARKDGLGSSSQQRLFANERLLNKM